MKQMIIDILTNYALGLPQEPPKNTRNGNIALSEVFYSILNIGWLNFQKGLIPVKMIDIVTRVETIYMFLSGYAG